MAGIDIESLATVYPNGVRAVDGLDLSVADGEFFALLGPSGCGKTTLLRTIAGLENASEGTVRIDGADVTRLEPGKRGVAMVFQDYALFPHMSVAENITYPLKVRRVAAATRATVAEKTSGELSLQGLLERRPGQLSGGQQQRVALARAIASEGKVLLLDEPLSNLDARLRLEARTFLKKLQRDLGITTVFVTHDQAEALALADKIAVMQTGKLVQLGSPREVFARPSNTFVANFIGSTPMNLLEGEVGATDSSSSGTVEVAGGRLPAATGSIPTGAKVTVGIRPEYLTLSTGDATGPSIHGIVVVAENLGTSSLVSVDCAGTLIGVTVPEEDEPAPGTPVNLTAPVQRVLLYDQDSGELLARQPVPAGSQPVPAGSRSTSAPGSAGSAGSADS
ncbi:ABC transporter ATP-binding protein [Kribbella italica]|uniref:Multiple sugar transport system ATP-binding protein n=1 Tax=Kribbella italica TaxID=1540520 RepID=A0A7W9JDT9_9ACTN|nr:ABC transporter ATP-binding protein [Kribbella italica]MBB5839875.1 multiple sugar transport system ATP-binding protein [Kribbella italica]